MFFQGRDTLYSCSKHNYMGVNQPCIDCTIDAMEIGNEYPEQCKLVAVSTGDGWGFYVEDKNGKTVAELDWNAVIGYDKSFITADELRKRGFEVV